MSLREIPVVILCGGMGTRLREETEYRPKPLVEIGGRPILWHIMKMYAARGFKRFILCLGYKGQMIKQYFLNYRLMTQDFSLTLDDQCQPVLHNGAGSCEPEGWSITFADTGAETMTGARVKRVQRFIDTDEFMLTYGDGVSDVDIAALLEFHRKHGKLATVTAVHPISRFGEMTVEGNRVVQFSEKPQAKDGFINGGFFVMNKRVLDYLSEGESCVLESRPLERLAEDDQLMTYLHQGFWHCMDTYRDFTLLNEIWSTQSAPWATWLKLTRPNVFGKL